MMGTGMYRYSRFSNFWPTISITKNGHDRHSTYVCHVNKVFDILSYIQSPINKYCNSYASKRVKSPRVMSFCCFSRSVLRSSECAILPPNLKLRVVWSTGLLYSTIIKRRQPLHDRVTFKSSRLRNEKQKRLLTIKK
jgi:hypothetical protein